MKRMVIWKIKRILLKLHSLLNRLRFGFPLVVECNVCGWRGRRFADGAWHVRTTCPACRSGVRHRLLAASLTHARPMPFSRVLLGKRVLHFAPEQQLSGILRTYSPFYVTADLGRPGVDRHLDISDMGDIADNAFDVVVACDVLEHVGRDRRALGELYRVLALGGYAVLTVPQKDGLAVTEEDPGAPAAERKRRFGQANHLRIYGEDFAERVGSVGFRVTVVDPGAFADPLVEKHVLSPPVPSSRPLATNHRKIFFARKPE